MDFIGFFSDNKPVCQYDNYKENTTSQIPLYTLTTQESPSSEGGNLRGLAASQASYVQLAADQLQPLDSPHLILFLDLNQTLLLGDIIQGKSPQDGVNDALTDLFVYQWDPRLPEMSYNTYVKEHLCPNPTKDIEIKRQQKKILSNFVNFLKESAHPLYLQVSERYGHAIAALEKQNGLLFASFYTMLQHLNEKKVPYTLIFRTFGADGPEVVKELNRKIGENFAVYKEEYAKLNCENPAAFYDYCKNVKEKEGRHIIIRDNWFAWNDHGEAAVYGKPFPMDFTDRKCLPLFFDDNAALIPERPEKNAVAPYDLEKGKPIDPKDAIDKKRLFVVSPLDALRDPDYFIRHIEDAIAHRKTELMSP